MIDELSGVVKRLLGQFLIDLVQSRSPIFNLLGCFERRENLCALELFQDEVPGTGGDYKNDQKCFAVMTYAKNQPVKSHSETSILVSLPLLRNNDGTGFGE